MYWERRLVIKPAMTGLHLALYLGNHQQVGLHSFERLRGRTHFQEADQAQSFFNSQSVA